MQDTLELVAGLPRKELLATIRWHHRQGEIAERALGFYLLDMERRKAFRPGSASAGEWARKSLGCQRADKLILLAKRLEELPRIRRAFDEGGVPWTKIREVARIANPETEESWLELARRSTSRELERALEGTKRGDRPGGGLKARVHKYLETLRLTGAQKAIWDQAIRKLMAELGKGTTPLEAAVEMARRTLEAEPAAAGREGREGTGGKEGTEGNEGEEAKKTGTKVGTGTTAAAGKRSKRPAGWCVVVFHRKADGSTWVDTPEGPLPVEPEELVRRIREGARTLEVRDLEGAGECPAIQLGEKGSVAKEDRDPPISPALRDAVFARDGYRCLICGSTEDLTGHHFDSHAHGGKGTMSRMGCLCRRCQGACHRGDILLRIDEEGRVAALDRDGEVISRFGPLPPVAGEAQRVVVRDAPGAPEEEWAPRDAPLPGEDRPPGERRSPAEERSPGERRESERRPAAEDPGRAEVGAGLVVSDGSDPGNPGAAGEAAPAEPSGSPRAFGSLEDLPRELSVAEWRRLQPCLVWSPGQRAFIFRPETELPGAELPEAELPEPELPEGQTPEAASGRGSSPESASSTAGDGATAGRRGVSPGSPARPGAFEDFVGQERVVGNLRLAARAARARGDVLGHVLLSGPPGLGKTTLARLLAAECGSRIQEVVAGSIGDPWQLVALLAGLEEGDILFIDEVHRLEAACEEGLYPALEDGTLDVVVREGSRSRVLRLRLERFTLVAATTRAGALSEPFRGRFRHRERLEPYAERELAEIVVRASTRLGTPASAEAAVEIARRSRGAPREAVRLLELARDVAQVERSDRDAKARLAHVGHGEAEMPGNSGLREGDASRADGADAQAPAAQGLADAPLAHVGHDDVDAPGNPGSLAAGGDPVGRVGAEAPRTARAARDVDGYLDPVGPADASVPGGPASSGAPASRAGRADRADAQAPANPGAGEARGKLVGYGHAEMRRNPQLCEGDASRADRADGADAEVTAAQGVGDGSLAHVGHGLSAEHVVQAAESLGIDARGLDRVEQTIVRFLARIGRPMGAEALASRLGVDLETFRDVHEPWLERGGLLERTERGRVATAEARALYGPGSPADAARRRPASAGPGARPRGTQGIPILRVPFRR